MKAAVEAINQVQPVPGDHEVGISGPQVLLGRPGDHPRQLVLFHMCDSHAHRLEPRRQVTLVVAFQLLFNHLDRCISLNHACSILYGLQRRPTDYSAIRGASRCPGMPHLRNKCTRPIQAAVWP